MTDPPRPRTSRKPPPPAGDDVRATSRRLAARLAPEDRSQPPPALPPWPDPMFAGPAPGMIGVPAPNLAEAADLSRAALARPALIGDAGPPGDEPEDAATSLDPATPTRGGGAGMFSSPAPIPPRAQGEPPGEVPAGVGVAASVAAAHFGLTSSPRLGVGESNPSSPQPVEDRVAVAMPDLTVAASRPDVAPAARFAPAPISPDLPPGPEPGDGWDLGEAPGVSGRLPALIAGLATIPSAVGEGASPGGAGPSPFGAGGDDFGLAPQASPLAGAGGAVDLSRTNELLQQILEALRRSPGASGPPLDGAGPAAFAGRL